MAKATALDRGVRHAAKEMAECDDRDAARYDILCRLIETIWANRAEDKYWKVDYTNLLPLTSPQAREVASFIESLF